MKIKQKVKHLKPSWFWIQAAEILPTVFVAGILAMVGILITFIVSHVTGYPVWKLAKDPAQILNFPPYIGMLSGLGVLWWMATAAISLFASAVMKKHRAPLQNRLFLLASGVFSLILAVDDFFLLHDEILPQIFHTSEGVFYLIYIVFIMMYILVFIRNIYKHEFLLFWISIFFLVLSRSYWIFLPILNRFNSPADILKHIGIVFWLAYFYRVSLSEVLAQHKTP